MPSTNCSRVNTGKPEKPSILEPLHDVSITEGESAVLSVQVGGEPSPKVEWYKDGKLIKDRQITSEKNTHTLTLIQCSTKDKGRYSVKVTNKEGTVESAANLNVDQGKAEFIKKLDDLEVKERENAVLEVEVTSDKADVKWFKDGQEIKTSKKVTIEKKGTIRKLLIRNISVHDEGEYTCSLPDQETSAELNVVELPPEISVPLQDVKVSRDEKASFEIELTKGDALVKWYKDGKEIAFSENVTLSIDGKKQKLIIFSAGLEDAGEYSCRVGDTGDKESKATLTVEAPAVEFLTKLPSVTLVPHLGDATFQVELSSPDIQVKWLKCSPGQAPLFIERFEEKTVKEKGTIRLMAKVKASPAPSIVWFRNNKPLLSSPKKREIFDGENIILELKEADSETDAGDYKVEKPVETAPVIDPPPPPEVLVKKGEDLKIEVRFKALPPPKAEWTVNGTVIVPSKRIIPTMEEDSATLTIVKFEDKDLGDYTISLSNALGQASATTKVTLLSAPGAPDTPEIVGRSDSSVTLHWRPPQDDGHSPVTGYVLESHDKDEFMVWNKIETTSTTYEVTKLTTKHEYMFRVAAVNAIGTGPASHNTRYVVVKAPVDAEAPVIQEPLKDSVAGFQSSVTLECVVSGVPTPDIKWYKDDSLIKGRNITYENNVARFTVVNCSESSEGRYTCKATNEAGTAETSCTLLVQGKEIKESARHIITARGTQRKLVIKRVTQDDETDIAPAVEFLSKLPSVTLVPHLGDATFQVELSSPDIQVKWLKKGKEIKESARHIITSRGTQRKLVIKRVTQDDETDIGVLALNVKSVSKLKNLPKINFQLMKLIKSLSSPPSISRYKDDSLIKGRNITYENNVARFTVVNCSESSEGRYTCKATNEAGTAETSCTLLVQEQPAIKLVDSNLKSQRLSVKSQWKVEVKYFGFPRPEISWMKNGAEITDSKACRIFIDEETSTIAIYSVVRADTSTYTVTATNAAGSTSLDLSLQVLGESFYIHLFPKTYN
ncbi:titin-like [Diaphorina citri]|uniref:Titin-like n=1 Tax=Diaphorina citri TaxID=121845 RepID=A0A3Q0JKM2_DIACI|nr:titin-like [Diaphorina citri]